MDIRELAKKVEAMRQARRDYFRWRDPAVLRECKHQEMEVDKLVSAILHPQRETQGLL